MYVFSPASNPRRTPTITIDARAAGRGKTTGGIYPLISRNLELQSKCLIVLPSTALQDQYKQAFPSIHVINTDDHDGDTVCADVTEALRSIPILCITHAAFLNLPHSDIKHLKESYQLILDETFCTFITSGALNHSGTGNQLSAALDLSPIMKPVRTNGEYVVLDKVTESQIGDSSLLMDSKLMQALLNASYDWNIHKTAFDSLMACDAKQIELYGTLSAEVFEGWDSIHIAASAFRSTDMAYWMANKGFGYVVTHEFELHSNGSLIIEYLTEKDEENNTVPCNWTGETRKKYQSALDGHRARVRQTPMDHKIISIRNNDQLGEILGETKVKHSVHGLNNLTDHKVVNIETSIRSSNGLASFLMAEHDVDYNKVLDWMCGYKFYQVTMRLPLRNQDYQGECKLFICDGKVAQIMAGYFEPHVITMIEHDSGIVREKQRQNGGRKKKPDALNSSQRGKKARAIKKFITTHNREPNEYELLKLDAQVRVGTDIDLSDHTPRIAA